ncbi:MAG TPA: hypothetical protein VGM05_12100 [Planctomycetaceae bacterium]|jgi:hypothetical protein
MIAFTASAAVGTGLDAAGFWAAGLCRAIDNAQPCRSDSVQSVMQFEVAQAGQLYLCFQAGINLPFPQWTLAVAFQDAEFVWGKVGVQGDIPQTVQ